MDVNYWLCLTPFLWVIGAFVGCWLARLIK